MKKLILTAILLVASSFAVSAQSMDKDDYIGAFMYDKKLYMIDQSSVVYAKSGNIFFWGLTMRDDVLVFISNEIDCRKSLLRIRSIRLAPGDGKIYTKKNLTPWMSPNDPVAMGYIRSICGQQM